MDVALQHTRRCWASTSHCRLASPLVRQLLSDRPERAALLRGGVLWTVDDDIGPSVRLCSGALAAALSSSQPRASPFVTRARRPREAPGRSHGGRGDVDAG